MTALGVHYLTGCAVAADKTSGGAPEFPPHFGRVFMALAATYFETRGDAEERAALEWLEAAGPPSMQAGQGHPRFRVTTYVPVNDTLKPGASRVSVPRIRQSRTFATTRLDDPFVYLRWTADLPAHLWGPLERLCNRVTRIGHSSSLVQMWLADGIDDSTEDAAQQWRPEDNAYAFRMRVTEKGTLAYLERAFNSAAIEEYWGLEESLRNAKGKQKNAVKAQIARSFPNGAPSPTRPVLTRWQGYAKSAEPSGGAAQQGPFDPNFIVLAPNDKIDQRVFGLEATLQLTGALRDAAMKAVGTKIPEWLSGHQPDERPSLRPHAAFFPLPFVGTQHADGHILGLAIAVPREIDLQDETREESLRRVLGALLFRENGDPKKILLWRSKEGEKLWHWELLPGTGDSPRAGLRAETWSGPARDWASITPVVLHHFPKAARDGDVERIVNEAFLSAGLPLPEELRIQSVSIFSGAGHVKAMPEFTEGGEKLCRYQVHLRARFASPVQGPLLVGRGRFRGYGLLRPMEARRG